MKLPGALNRILLCGVGISIIAGMWRWAVFHMYSLPEHSITAFTSITNNAFYVIGAIVVFLVSGKMLYDWKNTTSSVVTQVQQVISHTEKRMAPKDFDDGTIP